MNERIRPIAARDDGAVEALIRYCLKEFGADHAGTAWMDPDLGRFSQVYDLPGRRYWVAEDGQGRIVGGVGIGELPGIDGVCELQKMYCLPQARGTGVAQALLQTALLFAARHYRQCYLETLDNMAAAHRFYEKNGFRRIDQPLGSTGHTACDVKYLKGL
ncbi:MAG: GNAT family N-acetyltransferase [Clostridia bacterium]|nr:GNAT family N-acetyltransferase [Clostridia bacterium]